MLYGTFLGWITPVKDWDTKYKVSGNTIYRTTKDVLGDKEGVHFGLYTSHNVWIIAIRWRFKDWGYSIHQCTQWDYTLKFTTTPLDDNNKIWEIKTTADDLKIKFNGVEVLYFSYQSIYNDSCTHEVKGFSIGRVQFHTYDTATEMFTSETVGK